MMATAGLCGTCEHARVVENRRGSRFFLCERSHEDPRYPKYPVLPVLECRGYEPEQSEPNEPEQEDG